MRPAGKPDRAVPARHVKPELVAGKGAEKAEQQDEGEIEGPLLNREAGEQENGFTLEQRTREDDEVTILRQVFAHEALRPRRTLWIISLADGGIPRGRRSSERRRRRNVGSV